VALDATIVSAGCLPR